MNRTKWLLAAAFGMLLAAAIAALPGNEPDSVPDASLGMMLIDIADEKAAASYHVDMLGVYVLMVEEEGPAFRAGVRSGDRLVSVDGKPVRNTIDFMNLQQGFVHQQKINFDFRRGQGAEPLAAVLVWNENGAELH